jgi:fermentation-respiration switch protein FrsA (DUF1100 family)
MTRRQWRRLLLGDFSLRRIIVSLVFLYGCLVLLSCVASDWLAFHPPPRTYERSERIALIPTPDGEQLALLFYAPPTSNSYTLLYSHGNAEDLGFNIPLCEELHSRGFGVCAYDYRGYGLSTDSPSEDTAQQDALTVYTYLTNELGVAADKVIAHGRSLGGHMALYVAAHAPVAGLVLESTFITGTRVVSQIKILPFERFDNLELLGEVECPVLIIHGTYDTVIPIWHGRKLYVLAPEPKRAFWVEGANHNTVLDRAGENYYRQLQAFAASLE